MKNINDPMGLLESILESIDQHAAGPELKDSKELENKATEEKKPVELASDADNKDVYPAGEHKQEEDIDAVVVESEQVAAGPELKDAKELENEATEEKAPVELASDVDNKDVYPTDEHEESEDVESAVFKEELANASFEEILEFFNVLDDEEIIFMIENVLSDDEVDILEEMVETENADLSILTEGVKDNVKDALRRLYAHKKVGDAIRAEYRARRGEGKEAKRNLKDHEDNLTRVYNWRQSQADSFYKDSKREMEEEIHKNPEKEEEIKNYYKTKAWDDANESRDDLLTKKLTREAIKARGRRHL